MKVFLFAIVVVLTFSCASEDQKKVDVFHGYYYFPRPNVYYDTADKNFIYFDSAARKWQQGNLPPVFIQTELGKSILIDSAPQPVWSANKEHQLVYSAKLYADSTDFRKPPPPKKIEPTTTETTSGDKDDEPKKKSKVGELLDRIFGGKKKDN